VSRSGDREIELKWLSYLFSDYYILKIKNYIYYISKIYSKSLKINILIIILVIIFTPLCGPEYIFLEFLYP